MKSLALKLEMEMLICVFCLTGNQGFSNTEILLSQNKTRLKNVSKGIRLVSYTEILNNSSGPRIASLLEDGKSAWVSGYANFSSVVAENGCLNKSRYQSNLGSHTLGTANLDLCVRTCLHSKANIAYIGIQNTDCVCLENKDRESLTTGMFVNSSFCNFPCSNFDMSLCGGLHYLSIYRIVKNNEIVWEKNQPGPKQCINVRIKNDTGIARFSASVDSCFTSNTVRGYICTNGPFSILDTDECDKINSNSKYCLVINKSTRQEAFKDCLNKHGTLAEYFGEPSSVQLMKNGRKDRRYWISVFRTFQSIHQNFSKESVCLAVTKLSGKLYLEPDSCSTRKRFLYRQLKESLITDPDETILPLTIKHVETISASYKQYILTDTTSHTSDFVTSKSSPGKSSKAQPIFNVKTTNKLTTGFSGTVSDKDILPSTSEVIETLSVSVKHRSVTNDNVSDTAYIYVLSSTKTTLNPLSTVNLQTKNDRFTSYEPDFALNNNDRVFTPSSSQTTISDLKTVAITANKNVIDTDNNGISLIVYILLSSLLLIFVIAIVVLVIYLRKTKRQLKLQSRSQSDPGTGPVLNPDIEQRFKTHFKESSFSNIYHTVRRNAKKNELHCKMHASQDDQYDKIELDKIKPKPNADTSEYDHAFHVAGINRNDTSPPFMYSLAKDVTLLSSFYGSEDDMEPNLNRTQGKTDTNNIPTVNSNSAQEEEMHIYNVPVDATGEYITIGQNN